jgi:phosphoglycolate phosphatase-like HAD superfamily hydrolase
MHVVWDWNGTLLDDLDQIVAAVNVTLGERGKPPISVSQYGAHYQRPVQRFWESILDRSVSDTEWQEVDESFHRAYRDLLPTIALAPDARDALEAVKEAGHTQSLLSMLIHDDLVAMAAEFDIARFMTHVDGLRGVRGARKQDSLLQHLRKLEMSGEHVLMIGDAIDDADAAKATGTMCVMYDRGVFPREQIERTGVPTAGTLMDALRAGGAIW